MSITPSLTDQPLSRRRPRRLQRRRRVLIEAAGTCSGEIAVIERRSSGVIPSALVRTDSGGTRQVRTIDLAPVQGDAQGTEPQD